MLAWSSSPICCLRTRSPVWLGLIFRAVVRNRGHKPSRPVWTAVVLMVLAACGPGATASTAPTAGPTAQPTAAPTATVHQISGTFTLGHLEDQVFSDTSCRGAGGYDDIGPGTQVVVKDDTDRTVATGSLVWKENKALTSSGPFIGVCVFGFDLENVPDAPFYSIEVSHRGALTYSRADLESRQWFLELTLGTD